LAQLNDRSLGQSDMDTFAISPPFHLKIEKPLTAILAWR